MSNCTICQNPTFQQVIFIGAVMILVFGWHAHIASLIE